MRVSWLIAFMVALVTTPVPARTAALTGRVAPSEILVHTNIDDLNQTQSRDLTAALRAFAQSEKLSEFPNPTRGIGKPFYIGIFDTSRFSLVVEKATRDLPLVIECQDFSDGTSVCEAALNRLHVVLSERFQGLSWWLYRRDPLPILP